MSRSSDLCTAFVRGFPNQCIDDESSKEYFYRGLDDNNKTILDTIAEGSDRECTYAKITEKLEMVSCNNKAWSTRKLNIGRKTFALQATNNLTIDEIPEELAQMRTKLGLVLKHVRGGVEKVNAVNYITKQHHR